MLTARDVECSLSPVTGIIRIIRLIRKAYRNFPPSTMLLSMDLPENIVEAIEPYSEADPVAILVNTLTAFGNVIGSGPHFLVEKSEHHLNLFAVQVGKSAKGRKGTAWSTPRLMFRAVDPDWGEKRIKGGLSER